MTTHTPRRSRVSRPEPPRTYTDRETGATYHYEDYTDPDTAQYGFDGPYEPWEADSTALVHILWSLGHDGLIMDRPGVRAPLRQAVFDVLAGKAKEATGDLIADLRAVLDAHDPNVTPGAIGARYLTREEEDAAQTAENARRDAAGVGREPGAAYDVVTSSIQHSRWHSADTAYAKARALIEAALVEDEAGNPDTAARLRAKAEEYTGKSLNESGRWFK